MTIAGKILRTLGNIALYLVSNPDTLESYRSRYMWLRSDLLELTGLLSSALSDGVLTPSELADINAALQDLLNNVNHEQVEA